MRTNTSWSIDDHRNKFQFGCELGQLIENGKLTQVVKQPNYRGISANFWRSLVRRRQRGNARRVRHVDVRQGRTDADRARRPCVARLRVQRRRRIRRRVMTAVRAHRGAHAGATGMRTSSLLADEIDALLAGGEVALTSFAGEAVRLHSLQRRQGAADRPACRKAS